MPPHVFILSGFWILNHWMISVPILLDCSCQSLATDRLDRFHIVSVSILGHLTLTVKNILGVLVT